MWSMPWGFTSSERTVKGSKRVENSYRLDDIEDMEPRPGGVGVAISLLCSGVEGKERDNSL